jgi:hypothetical protein
MMDSTTPTPEMIDALTQLMRHTRRERLLKLVRRHPSSLVYLGDLIGCVAVLWWLGMDAGGKFNWLAAVPCIGIVWFYQWRISRLERRLDAMAGLLELGSPAGARLGESGLRPPAGCDRG